MQRAMARQAELRADPVSVQRLVGADFVRQLEAAAKVLVDQPHDVQVRFSRPQRCAQR